MITTLILLFILLVPQYTSEPINTPEIVPEAQHIAPDRIASTTASLIIGERGGVEQDDPKCWCGTYVRNRSQWQPPKVENVEDIVATRFEPKIGAWILFTYNHAGVVEEVFNTPNGKFIRISEKNRGLDCEVEERLLSADNKTIRGYFYF